MCGIAGFVGSRWDASFLGEALRRLEYRGYDSWGVATLNGSNFVYGKQVGEISKACLAIDKENFPGSVGIGHTRWATHGSPTATNAHPIFGGRDREVAVVHNGVIENHEELRSSLKAKGYVFETETDTEVIAHLFADICENTCTARERLRRLTRLLRGQYAFAVIIADDRPKRLLVACQGSPLLVSPDGLVASESVAFSGFTDDVYQLEDGQMAVLYGGKSIFVFDANDYLTDLRRVTVPATPEESLKDFPTYMLKEIAEQPECLARMLERKTFDHLIDHTSNFFLFGCGSSYHAALIGQRYLEYVAAKPTQCDYASELLLRYSFHRPSTNFIALTQSGETKDTVETMKKLYSAREIRSLKCITNNTVSVAARYCDTLLDLDVGKEVGVAATKTFTAQTLALLLMALNTTRPIRLKKLFPALNTVYDNRPKIDALACKVKDYNNVLFLGAGLNYPVALEAALKLKEVAYIHAEGMPAAEIKHGPIALIDQNTLSIFLVTHREATFGRICGNIAEIKARGGQVFVICDESSHKLIGDDVDDAFVIPDVAMPLDPIVLAMPVQLLAYYVAVRRGLNVDRPRSLAKTVTV